MIWFRAHIPIIFPASISLLVNPESSSEATGVNIVFYDILRTMQNRGLFRKNSTAKMTGGLLLWN